MAAILALAFWSGPHAGAQAGGGRGAVQGGGRGGGPARFPTLDPDVVDRALAMIDRAEYKRRQAPPGVKLRPKAFGRDRRTPITNRWPG